MKKRYLLYLATAAGAGWIYKKRQPKDERFERLAKSKLESQNSAGLEHTLKEAGIPDQIPEKDLAQQENAKMVAEGSQFGVQYYSELKDRESKLKVK